MRTVVVALVALLAVSAMATATAIDVDESNMSADEFDAAPFTPAAAEQNEALDADEMEADSAEAMDSAASDEEVLSEDESSDSVDELEGNTEFAASLLEADATAAAGAQAQAQVQAVADTAAAAAATSAAAATTATAATTEAAAATTAVAGADADAEKYGKGFKMVKIASKTVKRVRPPSPLKAKPFKFHSERVNAHTRRGFDQETEKLNLALAAVKEDILSTHKRITDERKWVISVAKIISAYNNKMKRVEAHIIALRKEMKALYRKKKQIENLKLQRALELKLKEARDELATLTGSLRHVALKKSELDKSGRALRDTIHGITQQLRKLRGQPLRRKGRKARKARKLAAAAAARGLKFGRKHGRKGKKCPKGKRFSKKHRKCVKKVKRIALRI